jgi:hypothetical protein
LQKHLDDGQILSAYWQRRIIRPQVSPLPGKADYLSAIQTQRFCFDRMTVSLRLLFYQPCTLGRQRELLVRASSFSVVLAFRVQAAVSRQKSQTKV